MNLDRYEKGKKAGLVAVAAICTLINIALALNGNITTVLCGVWLTSALYCACLLMIPSAWLLLCPLVSYCVILAATASPMIAMMAVVFSFCGALCADGIRKKESKALVSFKSAIPLAAAVIILMIFAVTDRVGYFNAESIEQMYTSLAEEYVQYAGNGEISVVFFSENSVYLPGLFVTYLAITGILCAGMAQFSCFVFGCAEELFGDKKWELRFSLVSALLYAAVFFLIFFESVDGANGSKAFYASVYTLYFPLSLAMLYSGTKTLCRFLGKTRTKLIASYIGVITLTVFAFAIGSPFPTVVIAGIGVFSTVKALTDKSRQ